MSLRTIFPSRLIGLYCLLVALSMLAHRQTTVDNITAFIHNPPAVMLASVLTLNVGLAIVLCHNG